jgi:TRAP-type C4-dicarboxylate transport system substrate-binding protein
MTIMRDILKRSGWVALAALCIVALDARGVAAQAVMKIGSATINDTQHHWMNLLQEAMARRAGSRLKVEVYPASQLGTIPRQVEGVQLGTIEAFNGPPDFYVGVDPRYMVLGAPGLFNDLDHAFRTVQDPEFFRHYMSIGDSKNMKGIGIFCADYAAILGRTPIRTMADLQGKKIRTFASRIETETLNRLGATAAPMPISEVMPALQTGALDAVKSGMNIYVPFKFWSVAKYITKTNEVVVCPVTIVSKPWFDALPRDLQDMILEESRIADRKTQVYSNEFLAKNYRTWTENGGELLDFAPAERAAFRDKLASVGDVVVKELPPVKESYELLKRAAARNK